MLRLPKSGIKTQPDRTPVKMVVRQEQHEATLQISELSIPLKCAEEVGLEMAISLDNI